MWKKTKTVFHTKNLWTNLCVTFDHVTIGTTLLKYLTSQRKLILLTNKAILVDLWLKCYFESNLKNKKQTRRIEMIIWIKR